MSTLIPEWKRKLAKEENLAKLRAYMKKLRADAKLVNHTGPKKRLPDTEENIANRKKREEWIKANPEKIKAVQKKAYEKRIASSRNRILDAIAQEEATRRRVEELSEDEP